MLARAAGDAGMVGGQALDMTLARGSSAAELGLMHARKTAALIEAAGDLGAVSARAGSGERALVRRYARALGLLFQATDDLLDVLGDAAALGKTPGMDDRNQRATLVATLGLDGDAPGGRPPGRGGARRRPRARLERWPPRPGLRRARAGALRLGAAGNSGIQPAGAGWGPLVANGERLPKISPSMVEPTSPLPSPAPSPGWRRRPPVEGQFPRWRRSAGRRT